MGQFRAWTSPLVLLALLVQGGLAVTITAIAPVATSLTTFTSTYSDTVTNTITSIVPITTTQTTCTPGTTNPLDVQCTNGVWSSNGAYWQEWCTTASLQGIARLILPLGNSYQCRLYCSIYGGVCEAANYNSLNHQCVLLSQVTATAAVSNGAYAALERFTTNPCVVTSTGSSTQLSIETAVVEQTTTITATITLPTSTSSPSPAIATSSSAVSSAVATTPTASVCSVSTLSTLPTTSQCVDGYYQHDGYYYQVLCDYNIESYSGFDITNSRQDDIWGCIEVCSQYSNCVGTFWFQGICYSPSSSLVYRYLPYDYEDPDNNVIEYIAMRLDGNPCPASSSSVSLIQSSAASSSAVMSSSAHTSAHIASSSAIVTPSPVQVGVSSSTPSPRSSSTPLIRSTATISPHSAPPSSARPSSTPVAPTHSNSVTVSPPAVFSTPASSVPIHSVSAPSEIASSVSNPASSVSVHTSASFISTSAISLTSTGTPSAPVPPGSEPSGHESSGPVPSTLASSEQRNQPTGSPGNSASSGLTMDTSVFGTATQTTGQTTTTAPAQFTTSTVFTTEVHTVTACPSSVLDCPAREKTTYITTETIAAYTTICPITAEETAAGASPTGVVGSNGQHESLTTSTVFTTQLHPTVVCPSHVKHCANSQKTTSLVTETVVAYVTVCPVAEAETTSTASVQAPSRDQDAATTLTTVTYITETATLATTYKTVNSGSTTEKTASYISTTVTPVTETVVVIGTETINVSPTHVPNSQANGSSTQSTTESNGGSTETASGVSGYDNASAAVNHASLNISHSTIPSSSAFISSTTQSIQSGSSMITSSLTGVSATTSPAYNGVASKTASWYLSSLFALAVVGYLAW
ncbi:hypothetical protein N7481_003284 [Penicillium waksmanii]|uniref:uncharacterized protein n=1 Tax=Penicillium waksmanii TaxID=69791 RepID=UPI002546A698|nr:uncharacterized protein N7481_003284 [Penicillium waksmanii]KAJ5988074.1 hypothetical protein N7481_003284 [Penicillium waksmanii]